MPLDTAYAGDMEEVKQDFIPVDTADDGEMEGNPDISLQADEGSPSILIQADECNPSISASPNISAQADKDSHNVSVIANENNLTPNPRTSIQADLSPNPKNPIQENVDPMEESQQNEKTMSSHNDADEASCHPSYTSKSNCNPNDIILANNYVECKPNCDTDEVKETVQAGGNSEDADLPDANLNDAIQANDNPNNAVLANGKPNEKVQADEQMISVDVESCEEAVFNAQLQEAMPSKEGSVIDAFSTGTEPEEGNRRSSLKRPRLSCFDNTPSVQVIYNCLTSESKNKLKELLRLWAEWHGECVGSKEEADRESLESGDEMHFPALQVGGGSKATMSFWMDKPSKHARTENATVELTPVNLGREKEVPLYDRTGTGALISQETETSIEGGLECVDEGSRCFNCGSYSHSLKECPRPRDNVAIVNARNLLAEKRGTGIGFRVPSRYYQSSRNGKFDDLKPGFLGSETRQLLGIGELDPPPWLNRMRELGYPPGYLEDQEDEPSGITIFGTSENGAEGSFIGEDGEIIGEYRSKKSVSKKMKVCFPGVNAPIPDDADQHTWGSPADFSGHGRSSYRVMGRTGHSSSFSAAALTSDGIVYTGTDDWEGPPGTGHDSYLKGSKVWSPSYEGVSAYSKTSSWQPKEQGRPGNVASGRSPHLGRSSSDSGRRSPKVSYDEPHTLPPLGGLYSGSRQSPMHSARPYQSPSTPSQRSPYGQEYREDVLESRRRAWAQAHDALQSMHRSDRHSPSRRR